MDEHDAEGQIDRRRVLQRGAVVGGAMLWTTPLVQAVSRAAFAADGMGSPAPGGGNGGGDGGGNGGGGEGGGSGGQGGTGEPVGTGDPNPPAPPPCVDRFYRFKFNRTGGFDNGDALGNAACLPVGYASSPPVPAALEAGISFAFSADKTKVVVSLPAGATLTEARAKAGAGRVLQCDTDFDVVAGGYELALASKEISFVAGVIKVCE
jgi:hypothetical protein